MNLITGTLAALRHLAACVPGAICVGWGHRWGNKVRAELAFKIADGRLTSYPGTSFEVCNRCGERRAILDHALHPMCRCVAQIDTFNKSMGTK